jgi:hypothetical protein
VLFADRAVVDVTHHVDDLAGDGFLTGAVGFAVLIVRERQWGNGK